jgi:DNA polymerase-1
MLRARKLATVFSNNFWSKVNFCTTEPIPDATPISLYDKFKGFHNTALEGVSIPGVTIVNSREKALKALDVLMSLEDRVHAWDTEVIDIEVKEQSPVGNGKIISAQAFCGPEVDFGNGPRLFIDNFGTNHDTIMLFKDYFESQKYKKIWHNYGFDRHVFYNHGIDAKGFAGDTMHLARLYDSSMGFKGYSLANLTVSFEKKILETKKNMIKYLEKALPKDDPRYKTLQMYKNNYMETNYKKSMYKLFGRRKTLRSGQEGKIVEIPPIVDLHTKEDCVYEWVQYGCLDAEITFFLRETLNTLLKELPTDFEDLEDMLDVYDKYWLPFGEMLTDMERNGIKVNKEYLKKIQQEAEKDLERYAAKFMEFVKMTQEDAEEFNPSSVQQLQQLLFAPYKRIKKEVKKNPDEQGLASLEYLPEGGSSGMGDEEVYGDEAPKRKMTRDEPDDFPEVRAFNVPNTKGIILPGKKAALKNREMLIKGLGINPIEYTETGLPSADTNILKILAGDVKKKNYGEAYKSLKAKGQEELGIAVCEGLGALLDYRSTETLIGTFIIPLQNLPDKDDRIHSSLNIFTETGRLASRRPNLQNQPALDKDKYKIRYAFIPEEGKKFIVADYGQLELRILAHITNCKSMLDAFKSGGDFHSRTAVGMYPYIKKELQDGKVLLEWDYSKGTPPMPLIKDKYAAERKKSKAMNFSIAYGKSAHGFSKDWGCTIQEAQQTLDAWYADRPEVKNWQEKVKNIALDKGWTQTLIGRYRNLSKMLKSRSRTMVNHALRACINTPIQGGAADLVVAAMIKLHANEKLREMGWKMVLQVHDEVIMEGPAESAEEALKILTNIMENPFDDPLRVGIEISSAICDNWYEAK